MDQELFHQEGRSMMKKSTSIWLIVAFSLVLIGFIIIGCVLAGLNWDFSNLSTAKYETNIYEIDHDFRMIMVETDTADLTFKLSDDGTCRVECYENSNDVHTVTVKDGTLMINETDDKVWYDHIGFQFDSPNITVYLPKTAYGSLLIKERTGDIELPQNLEFKEVDISLSTGDIDCFSSVTGQLKMEASTGHIHVENLFAGTLDLTTSTGGITVTNVDCREDINLNVSTGKTDLTNITCHNLNSTGSTGDVSLDNVIAAGRISIDRSTGDATFDRSDAAEIFVKTDTGDVTGNFVTEKVFITNTDTGDVKVPRTTTGGICEITTNTGDINITNPVP